MRLIDADALQCAFDDAHKDKPDYYCCNFLNNAGNPSTEWDCVDDILESAPTIDAQPVKCGKWSKYSRNALETYIECTNCCVASRPIHLQMVTRDGLGLPDYCPNCGAKMRCDADADS